MFQHRLDATEHNWRDLIESALARHIHYFGRNVRIELADDHVVLKGTVRSYYQKQLAQESVRQANAVVEIRNEIEVAAV